MNAEAAAAALGNNGRNHYGRLIHGSHREENEAAQQQQRMRARPHQMGRVAFVVMFVVLVAVIVGFEEASTGVTVSGKDSAGVSRPVKTIRGERNRGLIADVKANKRAVKRGQRVQSPAVLGEQKKETQVDDGGLANDLYSAAKVFDSSKNRADPYDGGRVVYGKVVKEIGWDYDPRGFNKQFDGKGIPSSTSTFPIEPIEACAADCSNDANSINKQHRNKNDQRIQKNDQSFPAIRGISAILKKEASSSKDGQKVTKNHGGKMRAEGLEKFCDRFFYDDDETRDSCHTIIALYHYKKELAAKRQGQMKNHQPPIISHAFSLVCDVIVLSSLLAKLLSLL